MRVSLLIPCYNAAAYVGAAIASARAQTRPVDEIIVVDDGSTDGSAAIVARSPAVMLLRQPNQGVAAALNTALKQAIGELIAFLDADDLWAPGKLALQTAALHEDKALDGVFSHMTTFQDGVDPEWTQGPATPGLVKGTLLIRRAALDRLGQFDPAHRHGDFIAWYARAAALGFRWKMLPETMVARRLHAGNMGRRARPEQHEDYLLTMKEFLDRRRQ